MTISSETRKAGPYPGNGVTTAFPFAFKVFTAADLAVTLNVLATGAQTLLTLTSDYTVALNPDQNANPGGTVTYNPSGVPMPSTKTLTIGSVVTNTQGYQPTNSGGWLPTNAGDAWDRATILIQQLAEKVGRSLRFPIVDSVLTAEVPSAALRASKLLGFDSSGNVVVVSPADQSASSLALLLAGVTGATQVGVTGSGTVQTSLDSKLPKAGGIMAGPISGITDLTTTGNTILGDASTDTLNVCNGGIIKDATGKVGLGQAPRMPLDVAGEVAAAAQLRAVPTAGSTAGIGAFLRNDGTNTFLMLTANNDAYGSFNAFRPLTITNATGKAALDGTATSLSTATGAAPSYSARAWVNFNGTGTIAIRGAGNVSSITDLGVGTYGINFTTALPDALSGYAINTCDDSASAAVGYLQGGASSLTAAAINVLIVTVTTSPVAIDKTVVSVVIFR